MVIFLSLLIQKPCGIGDRSLVEKMAITGKSSRKAGQVDRPPIYDKKRAEILRKSSNKLYLQKLLGADELQTMSVTVASSYTLF